MTTGALVVCTLALALCAPAAHAIILPLASFGSGGFGAGQFHFPMGVAIDQGTGDAYVVDSGNARVQKFDATGTFILGFGWGVADGMAQAEVCTSSCQVGLAGSGAGQFSNATSIAVDSSGGASNGDVYVGDAGNNVVTKFDTNGNFLATIDGSTTPQTHFTVVAGVSVDQSGHLWVADGNTNFISEFDESGTFVQQWQDPFGQTLAIVVDRTNSFVYLIRGAQTTERFSLTGADETVIDNGAGVQLGLDPASGNLFVDHASDVTVYNSGATQIDAFTLTGTNSQGITFGTTAGNVYATDATANNVTIYGVPTTPGPPLVSGETATNITNNSATLNATVVPFGLDTTCVFQYVDDASFQASGYDTATTVPCVPSDLGSVFDFVPVTADISGLTQGTTYHFRAVATNADGTVNGSDQTFQTAGPPVITNQPASNITDTTATLNTQINPFGLDTTCEFQYVDDATFQGSGYASATTVPCSPPDLGSSFSPQFASADISGLTPGTTYHFRAVATNSAATVNGDDQTFTTFVAGPPMIVSESTANVTDAGATLQATINPTGFDTTCVFQYVDDATFQMSQYTSATTVPCSQSDLGSGFSPQNASAGVTGLTQGTTYHFRVVATNSAGTVEGADQTFQTRVAFMSQVGSFGTAGTGAGQFQTPIGVAVDQNGGKVYVADSANARIQRFNTKGKFSEAYGWGVKNGNAESQVCTNVKSCQPGIPGSGEFQFSNPTSVAVDSSKSKSKGAVYVGDAGNNRVTKFKSSGKLLGTIDGSTTPQGPFQSLAGVAVDQSGNLWTADAGTGNIDEFDPTGNPLQQWSSPSGVRAIAVDSVHSAVYLLNGGGGTDRFTLTGTGQTPVDSNFATALGLDPSTGNLYVDHGGSVVVYDPTGIQINALPSLGGGATTNSLGIAYLAKSKSAKDSRLYASDASNDLVLIYGPPPSGVPFVTSQTATNTTSTSETLNAAVVPLGHDTTCVFQVVGSADFLVNGYTNAPSLPCTPASLGSTFNPQTASATVSGLTVGSFYHFRVVATNSKGTTNGADQTFQAGPGLWTPFYRCPVDDPVFQAADGVTHLPICLASNSTHGSITLGNTMSLTGNTNLQLGLVFDQNASVFTVIAPAAGAIISDPVPVTVAVGPVMVTVIATVESAGAPSDFDLGAGLSTGMPILTLPIKIHLTSPPGAPVDLGPVCFIGSDMDPIVLHPENTDISNASLSFGSFDPNGDPDPNGPLQALTIGGITQGDNTFAVPGASACGPNGDGTADSVVNSIAGLPSPSGNNHLVLNDASNALALGAASQNGHTLADQWHVAFGGP